jgi:hypothetical protein
MDYEKKASGVAAKSCARCGQEPDMIAAIAAFGRECAAEAYRDAAKAVYDWTYMKRVGGADIDLVEHVKARASALRGKPTPPSQEGSCACRGMLQECEVCAPTPDTKPCDNPDCGGTGYIKIPPDILTRYSCPSCSKEKA